MENLESGATTPEARGDLTARFRQSSRRSRISFDRESIDEFCERGILGVVLAMLVWAPLATGSTRTSQFLVLLGLGSLLCGFWLVRTFTRKQYRFLFPPLAWAVLAFAGYAIWRYTWVDYEFGARLEILQIILYGLLFFAILDNLTSSEHVQIILFTLIGVGMLNAFYAIFQYFTDSQSILWFAKPPEYRGRGSGTYACPNHLAGYLEMILPVALAYTVLGRYKPLTKVFLGYAALTIVAGIGVTLSRGGYLATAAALLVFFALLLWNRDFRLPAIGLIVLLLGTAAFFGVRSWQAEKRFATAQQYQMRILYWKPAMEMWKENFWFGVGPQHYDWRLRKWRHWQLQGRPIYVHNDYLNTAAEYGAAGAGLTVLALGALGWTVARTWKYVRRSNEISTRTSTRSAVVLGSSIGLLAILFHSASDFNMHIPANALAAVTLMAVLASHIRFATERFWIKPGTIGRALVAAIVLAGGSYMVWQMTRLTPHTYWLSKYHGALDYQQRRALLQKAHAAESKDATVVMEMGETYRQEAFDGNDGWQDAAREAIRWFQKTTVLNKWNPFPLMNTGACYDRLREFEKAAPYFDQGLALDPNGFWALFWYGWHKMQLGDLEAAHKYILTSYKFNWWANPEAKKYVEILESQLAEERARTKQSLNELAPP